jgi:hypothetical protein
MVPRRLDGERQLLRTGLRQGAASHSQKRLVPRWLARERQLLHPLSVRSWGILAAPAFSNRCEAGRSAEPTTDIP